SYPWITAAVVISFRRTATPCWVGCSISKARGERSGRCFPGRRKTRRTRKKMPDFTIHPASYRDPSGFVFRHEDQWYRQLNTAYREDYLRLMDSGLYDELITAGLLLPHREVPENFTDSADWFKTLLPEQLT